jgi:hypothetical protein
MSSQRPGVVDLLVSSEVSRVSGGDERCPVAHAVKFAEIEKSLRELRSGRMIVIADDEDRENEGDLMITSEFNAPSGTKSVVVKGFSGDSKTRSPSTAYSPSSPEVRTSRMKYSTLLGPIPRSPSSITWYLPSAAFAIPGMAKKSGTTARRHWDADWLPTFVFNTLNRVTVAFAPLLSIASSIVAHPRRDTWVLRGE